MSARSMRNFLEHYGTFRLQQILEILSDPNDPAPQEHIAEIMDVSKSTVSKWVKDFIHWKPELNEEEAREADLWTSYELHRAVEAQKRVRAVPRHKPVILRLSDETRHSA